jgi:hypothetical protein
MESALFTAAGGPGAGAVRCYGREGSIPAYLGQKISGCQAPEAAVRRRSMGATETVASNAANANPGNNFRGASAKGEPGVPRIEENDHDIVVL